MEIKKININGMPDEILHAEPMTVGELKKKIHNLPSDTPVYIVLDKLGDDAWDEVKEQWRYVVPLAHARRECIRSEEGDELNLLLEYEDY